MEVVLLQNIDIDIVWQNDVKISLQVFIKMHDLFVSLLLQQVLEHHWKSDQIFKRAACIGCFFIFQ